MKTIILFIAAVSISAAADAPKFLLVWQRLDLFHIAPYSGSGQAILVEVNDRSNSDPKSVAVQRNVERLSEVFDTEAALRERVKSLLGAGNSMSLVKPDDIVGIWRLDDGARLSLRVWKETRVIPEHVAERKVEEIKVEIGGAP